jgi:hypothetical protein
MICDIRIGSVTISSNNVVGNQTFQSVVAMIVVIGNSTTNPISITNAIATIVFQDINVNTTTAVTISGNSATLVGAGRNIIWSTAAVNAGSECSLNWNITMQAMQAIEGSWLFVTGGSNTAGIGTGGNGMCGFVTIWNGSVDSLGGTGIGSGWGENGYNSKLESLSIRGGWIRATGMNFDSGIGSGRGPYGNSTVMNVVISNGNVTAGSSLSG